MANFNFTVTTDPMASSINSVKNNVNVVTGAVTVMQSAVIAAEEESARKISQNVDSGFFMLAKSQISQKKAALFSKINSSLLLMKQFQQNLTNLENQMQKDYNMISRRYTKLFNSLDKSLKTRVQELDKPAMDIASLQRNLITSRTRDSAAEVLVNSVDSLMPIQKAKVALLKNKTATTLSCLSENIIQETNYVQQVNNILLDDKKTSKQDFFLPIVYSTKESLVSENKFPYEFFTSQTLNMNEAQLSTDLNEETWNTVSDSDFELVSAQFIKKCSNELQDERIRDTALKLFNSSKWDTFGGEA